VGVLFYLKPDGQYMLADDDGMAVFLFIVIMLSAMIDSGRSFLLNTAIIASLSKIYCASDLKKKRTLTVYKNITQYNNQQKHSHDSVTNSNMLSI
jgi:hypothetical protein